MSLRTNLLSAIAAGVIVGTVAASFTCTRNSVGYAATAEGTLQSFAVDTIRTTTKGTLVEKSYIQQATHSQTLDSWAHTNATITADGAAAPDGTTTAETITNDATSGSHHVSHGASLSVTGSGVYTGSVFAKAGTHRYLQITFAVAGFSNNNYVNFDLLTGAVTATNSFTLTSTQCGIEPYADGWFRCWMNDTATGGSSTANMIICLAGTATSTRQQSYVGTGTTLYLWGADFRASTGCPGAYIPTVASSVTSAADIITASVSGIAAGSIVSSGLSYAPRVAGTNVFCQWDDGSENNRIQIYRNSSKEMHYVVTSGGVDQCDINLGIVANGGAFRIGAAWSANDFAAAMNGWTSLTDASGTIPSGLTTFRIGTDSAGANPWNGYVSIPTIYSSRKSNGFLESSTNYPMVPVSNIILDLDIDSDVDDAGDLLVALGLRKLGECNIIAMPITSANGAASGCAYAILNAYGATSIPIGVTTTDPGNSVSRFDGAVVARDGVAGHTTAANFPSAVTVCRTALAAAADRSVAYITTGGAQSLYDLLNSPADGISALTGAQLLAQKLRQVWNVAGQWPTGTAVSDMNTSHTAFQSIFDNMPVRSDGSIIPMYLLDVRITVPQYLGTSFMGLAAGNSARYAWEKYWEAEPADPTSSTRDANSPPAILAAVRGMANRTRVEEQYGAASVRVSDSQTGFRGQVNRGQAWVSLPADLSAMETETNSLIALGP